MQQGFVGRCVDAHQALWLNYAKPFAFVRVVDAVDWLAVVFGEIELDAVFLQKSGQFGEAVGEVVGLAVEQKHDDWLAVAEESPFQYIV